MKSPRVSLGLLLVALGASVPVWSRPGYGATFDSLYPTSTADDDVEALAPNGSPPIEMDCLLCHGFYTFDAQGNVDINQFANFNEYGLAIRDRMLTNGFDLGEAIGFVENQDSDGDPGGHTNLQEILAGTQPGWRPGNVNTIHVTDGGPNLVGQLPPAGLTSLDPASGGITYCTAKTDSTGCTPTIGSVGFASLADNAPFDLTATGVRNNVFGALFFGTSGRAAMPLAGGAIMCVQPPVQRTVPQFTFGSSAGPDCSGSLSFEANAGIVQTGGFAVGDVVNAQYYVRDPGSVAGLAVSQGIEFVVCP